MSSSPYKPLVINEEWREAIKVRETFMLEEPKGCPFCPRPWKAYTYKYKTFRGLLLHILETHCVPDLEGKNVKWVRVYAIRFSKWEDVEVNGWSHLVEMIRAYCEGFNPSLRGSPMLWSSTPFC